MLRAQTAGLLLARLAALVPVVATAGTSLSPFVEPGSPSATPAADVVNRFDLAVATGLPAYLDLADAGTDTGNGAREGARRVRRDVPHVVVRSALKVTVEMPGLLAGHMFDGTVDGREAAFTRIGDHLDISVAGPDGVDFTGYSRGNPGVLHESARDPRTSLPQMPTAGLPRVEAPAMRLPRAIEDPLAWSPRFHVFIHDDLAVDARRVHSVFAAWWLADLSTRVLPVENIRVRYLSDLPGVTDMPYGYPEALENWHNTVAAFSSVYRGTHGKTYKHKFLLLTRDRPMAGTFGIAYEGGAEAIASTAGRVNILAHEFGHTLGAVHQDARQHFVSWWWCASNMWPGIDDMISDCHGYAYDNARRIRSYMRHGPDPQTLAARRTATAD